MKKIPCILTIFYNNNHMLILNKRVKTSILFLLNIPHNWQKFITINFNFTNRNLLANYHFIKKYILWIIKNVDLNKANYCSVAFLPIRGKVFECLLYDTKFDLFFENNLLAANQSGFRPRDFCINQHPSINHENVSAFDMGCKVCRIFFGISKAFDKVLHDELIFNLRQNRICSEMINILRDFLSHRK